MKVIWKRPDGFHGASPSDYDVIEVSPATKIWLHKVDKENFPFRVSGGWLDEAASRRLNQMVNLLSKSDHEWSEFLRATFANASTDNFHTYLQNEVSWISELTPFLKGDHWEVEIMTETLQALTHRLEATVAQSSV
jgi:hypothetical protein